MKNLLLYIIIQMCNTFSDISRLRCSEIRYHESVCNITKENITNLHFEEFLSWMEVVASAVNYWKNVLKVYEQDVNFHSQLAMKLP